ncbi:MAG: hypothetical protein ABIG43_04315 [Chloroflexota bacterium]
MARLENIDKLSKDDLRQLLLEKQLIKRQDRLASLEKTDSLSPAHRS